MNWLKGNEKEQIRRLACLKPNQEACGFVLNDGHVVEVKNKADDPVNQFVIDHETYAEYEDEIKGVWHSHLELAGFSELDQQVISTDVLPWAVYCLRDDSWHECNPLAPAPFEGRPFVFGTYDCYSLVTDFLRSMDVQLPQWKRGQWGEWDEPDFLPFDTEWKKHGRPIMNHRYSRGDILLMNLGNNPGHTDHLGVMVDSKQFLHHPSNGISRKASLGSYYQRRLNWVIRPFALCKS